MTYYDDYNEDDIDFDNLMSQEEVDEYFKEKKDSSFDPLFSVILDPYYKHESSFQPFWSFESRLSSLQRYFEYTYRYINDYLNESRNHLNELMETVDKSSYLDAGSIDIYNDMIYEDEEYFLEHHLSGIISIILSLLESLLNDVALDIAKQQHVALDLPSKQMPYINKYLYFIEKTCGLTIGVDSEMWKRLNTIREIRNKYIHNLGKNISNVINEQIKGLLLKTESDKFIINYDFAHLAFLTISDLAKKIELSYLKYKGK